MELVEWFRWRIRKKKKVRYHEQNVIPDIRIIKVSKNTWRRFTDAQDMLREQFPGLTKKDWWKKL
jgi:hypothetical protein